MKKTFIFIIVLTLIVAAVVIAETRREKEDEFIKQITNIEETQTLDITIRACDPDGNAIIIDIEDLPEGAVISDVYLLEIAPDPNECDNDPNNCIECFEHPDIVTWYAIDLTWTPSYSQEGEYKLYVHAMDDQGGDDWVVYIINVANKNRPPIL